jgi:hypothetical protein
VCDGRFPLLHSNSLEAPEGPRSHYFVLSGGSGRSRALVCLVWWCINPPSSTERTYICLLEQTENPLTVVSTRSYIASVSRRLVIEMERSQLESPPRRGDPTASGLERLQVAVRPRGSSNRREAGPS